MKLRALALVTVLLSFSISAENYFPLSVGSVWYYSMTGDESGSMTTRILTDSIIGSTQYFLQETVIEYGDGSTNDTTLSWLYISGNDVYGLEDLSQPDEEYKTAQLTYQEGDIIVFPVSMLGEMSMEASSGGSVTVGAGTYAQTWKTVANEAMLQVDMTNYYADGVGMVKADYDIMGFVFGFDLDSFTIADPNPVLNKFSRSKNGSTISAEKNGIILHSSSQNQSTVSVFAVSGQRIARKTFPTNTLISYSALGLNKTSGRYIVFSENSTGSARLMLPQLWK